MSEIVFRGYLYKSPPETFGSSLKPWRLRWFVLADSRLAFPFATPYVRLEYYTNEELANELDEPKGVVDLKDCIDVIDRRPMKGHDFVFDLCTDKRSYHFAAPSIEIKTVWMDSLSKVLGNKTEKMRRKPPTVTPRLGLGRDTSTGDMSLESPIYGLPLCSTDAKNSTEEVLTIENEGYERLDSWKTDGELVPPASAFYDALPANLQSEDNYQHLQHKKPDVNPPPIKATRQYDSLPVSYLQLFSDDYYHHLDHKKSNNARGGRSATITYGHSNKRDDDQCHLSHQRSATTPGATKSSLYSSLHSNTQNGSHLNKTEDDGYHHLSHQCSVTITPSVAKSSLYSSLHSNRKGGSHLNYSREEDDYHHLNHQHSATVTPVAAISTLYSFMSPNSSRIGDHQSSECAVAVTKTSHYSQPHVPPIPAKRHSYENSVHNSSLYSRARTGTYLLPPAFTENSLDHSS